MDLPVVHVCALAAYDGTDTHGFQVQAGVPTVQGELESALQAVALAESRVVGAGRTDAGVHASGQVIAVKVRWRHSPAGLQSAWNAHLPPSISLRRLRLAPEGFHPRFSALWRTYRYTVLHYAPAAEEGVVRHAPLIERYAWFVTRPLDLTAMQAAARRLVGEHDFAAFGQPTQGESTVRYVAEAHWQEQEQGIAPLDPYPGKRLVFTVTANAFLRQMVRTIVGVLVAAGRGEWSPDDVQALLASCDRSRAAPPAPPNGLVLERVSYPKEFDF